jgi:hypothetical protein
MNSISYVSRDLMVQRISVQYCEQEMFLPKNKII